MSLRGEEANPFQGHVDSTTYPAPRSSPGHEALLPRKKPVPTRIAEVSEHIQSSPNGLKTPVQPELARWGIHWRTPSTMAILFLCGIIFALGHHFYYNSLDGEFNTGRDSQEWAIRIGTALAFLARASLDSAAAMAYMQYSWLRLRKRPTTIGGVDSILGALTDFSALVDMNKFRQSKMSSLLAILVWCIPLSAIVPPAALTVNSVLKHDLLSERVPEINWPDLPTQTGGFGYWLGAGEDLYRLATTTAYGMSVLPMVPRYNNYTYDLEFFAPALKCGSVRPEAQAAFNAVLGADWNASPTTQYAYEALLVGSWILSNSNLTSSDPHLLDNELLFRTPDKNFTCQTWNVSYTAQIEFQNGAQSIRILRQRDLERFVSKTERYEVAFGEDPPEAFGYRSWLETIKFLLQGSLFSAGAQGQPRANSTKIMQTGLTGCPEMKLALVLFQTQGVPVVHDYYCRNGTLEKAIEDLGRNITFSLFGYSNGILPRNVTSPRPLRTTYTANVYSYSRRILLSSYGAGVLLTLLIVIFGTSAILKNGVVHNSNFSGIMCATRNPDFDELARGSCLAAEPMRKDVKKVKVLFGVLDNGGNNGHEGGLEMDDRRRVGSGQGQGSVGHAAFGVKGTVRRFKKGEKLS